MRCAHAAIRGGLPPPPPHGCTIGLRTACLGWPPLASAHARVALAAGWGVPVTLRHAIGARFHVWGSSFGPYLRAEGVCCWVRGTPPPLPPWWPHALSRCCCLGGLCSLLDSSVMPRARGTCCLFWFPVSVSLSLWFSFSPIFLVAIPAYLDLCVGWIACRLRLPAPLSSVSRTCLRDMAYHLWRRWDAYAVYLRCLCPSLYPLVG